MIDEGNTLRQELTIEIEIPTVPSSVRWAGTKRYLAIEDMTDAMLAEVGRKWTVALVAKARERRAEG